MPHPCDLQPHAFQHDTAEDAVLDRHQVEMLVSPELIEFRLLSSGINKPVLTHSTFFVLEVLFTSIDRPAFGTDDLNDQVGGTFEVVRFEP